MPPNSEFEKEQKQLIPILKDMVNRRDYTAIKNLFLSKQYYYELEFIDELDEIWDILNGYETEHLEPAEKMILIEKIVAKWA
jgi:hypothetical protein